MDDINWEIYRQFCVENRTEDIHFARNEMAKFNQTWRNALLWKRKFKIVVLKRHNPFK